MRVFLDTNVLLSGLFGSGLCARLLDTLVLTGHTLVIGEPVLAEFTRIAREKFQVPEEDLTPALDWLRRHEVADTHSSLPLSDVPDPDDRPVIACALAAEVTLFITGDQALLELGSLHGLRFVSPRTVYDRLHSIE
ncbi:putative toxin-antitoxin system toxin component, PIN family [Nitrospira calida]